MSDARIWEEGRAGRDARIPCTEIHVTNGGYLIRCVCGWRALIVACDEARRIAAWHDDQHPVYTLADMLALAGRDSSAI